jgi:hypothetical protein
LRELKNQSLKNFIYKNLYPLEIMQIEIALMERNFFRGEVILDLATEEVILEQVIEQGLFKELEGVGLLENLGVKNL